MMYLPLSYIVLWKSFNQQRNYLKRIATLFDPLGMLSPFVIRAKVLMQEIWVCGLDWDDPLPEELSAKMMSWFGELPMLSKIRVPRCLQLREVTSATLHVRVCRCIQKWLWSSYLYEIRIYKISFIVIFSLKQSSSFTITGHPSFGINGSGFGETVSSFYCRNIKY